MDIFIRKEANIWACIYRSVNIKRDNIKYDEENENSRILLANSFKESNALKIRTFTYHQQQINKNSEQNKNSKVIQDDTPLNAEKREVEIEEFFDLNLNSKHSSNKNDGLEGYPSMHSQDICNSGNKIEETETRK